VHHPLGNALAIEVLQLLDQLEVLQQQWPAAAGAPAVLVVGDRVAGCRCESRAGSFIVALLTGRAARVVERTLAAATR